MERITKHKVFKPLLAAGLLMALPLTSSGAPKNVMCLKTNTGQYIELCRVSMMVAIDGQSTFNILVKDGSGASGVSSITFEKHASDIDLTQYGTSSDGSPYINQSLPVWLQTNDGRSHKLSTVQMLANIDGRGLYEVVGQGYNETGVRSVRFVRSQTAPQAATTAITPAVSNSEEQLQLATPVRQQLTLSYLGDARTAQLFTANGMKVGESAVTDGTVTLSVEHLPAGVYIVRVGNKSLKFNKN